MSLLRRLRDQTRPQHDVLERHLDLLRRPWSPGQYRALLRRFFGYYDPLEARVHAATDWSQLGFDWLRRRKVPLLQSDLLLVGDSPEVVDGLPRCHELPGVSDLPQALGCLYVLEGATLGGRIVSSHLIGLKALVGGNWFSFFSSYGDDIGPMWQAFGKFLSARAGENDDVIVRAAQETFETLGHWLLDGSSEWADEQSSPTALTS